MMEFSHSLGFSALSITMTSTGALPYGNGVLLWFETADFEIVIKRAAEMGVEMIFQRLRNPPDLDQPIFHWECWMRDRDGYVVVVASPFFNPDLKPAAKTMVLVKLAKSLPPGATDQSHDV